MRALAGLVLALGLLAGAPPVAAEVAVPPLRARVTDLTATLDDAQRQSLEQALAAFEARKGAQLAVLIVPSTQPETIEQYAVRVQERWKLGRKGVDDGVLLVVAKDDRRLRIEVGYGLEGIIPDAVAKRVIEEDIAPRFRQGDFHGGIRAGTERLMRLIDGEPLPPPKASDGPAPGPDWVGGAVVALLVFGGILRAIFGRFLGALLAGGIMGAVVWFVFSVLSWSMIAGVVAFIVMLVVDGSGGGRSWSGGSGSWGGSSGGGFSGGGGSSGGGGASGSW